MAIADILRTRRSELGLTLKEIADKVGVSEATVQRYESGNIRNLRQDKIAKLASALEVSPSFLMGWTDDPESIDSGRFGMDDPAEQDDPNSIYNLLGRGNQKKEAPPDTTEEALRKYFIDKLGRDPSEEELRRLDDFAETFIKGLDK